MSSPRGRVRSRRKAIDRRRRRSRVTPWVSRSCGPCWPARPRPDARGTVHRRWTRQRGGGRRRAPGGWSTSPPRRWRLPSATSTRSCTSRPARDLAADLQVGRPAAPGADRPPGADAGHRRGGGRGRRTSSWSPAPWSTAPGRTTRCRCRGRAAAGGAGRGLVGDLLESSSWLARRPRGPPGPRGHRGAAGGPRRPGHRHRHHPALRGAAAAHGEGLRAGLAVLPRRRPRLGARVAVRRRRVSGRSSRSAARAR